MDVEVVVVGTDVVVVAGTDVVVVVGTDVVVVVAEGPDGATTTMLNPAPRFCPGCASCQLACTSQVSLPPFDTAQEPH